MNKAIKIIEVCIMMITLSVFVSCHKEKPVDNEVKMIEISAVADYEPHTKTHLSYEGGKYKVKWSENETVAVLEEATYASGSRIVTRANSIDGNADDDNNTMSFSISFLERNDAKGFGYHAVYPSKALPEKSSYSLSQVEVNLSNVQRPTADSFGPEADVLISDRLEYEKQTDIAESGLMFVFTRPTAIGEMIITNLLDNEDISRITFTAGTSDKKINITGKTNYNLINGTVEKREDGSRKYGTNNTVVLEYTDGLKVSDNSAKAYFTAWPFKISGKQKQSFSINVETSSKIYTRTFTLSGENVLNFIGGKMTTFTASLKKADVENKSYKTVLPGNVKEGIFIISSGDKMMTAGENSNYFNVKPLITEHNDGLLIVNEENLSSAWRFTFDDSRNTYKIASISEPGKYVYGAQDANTLKLIESKDATEFSITENAGNYNITVGNSNRYIAGSGDKFSMLYKSGLTNVALKLSPAVVSPVIKVVETVGIKNEGETVHVPVSYFNVSNSTVNITVPDDVSGWLTATLSDDKSVIDITAAQNEGGPRSTSITINGDGVVKNIKITQYGAAIYHTSLAATDLKEARDNGSWMDNEDFDYSQQNGAQWKLKCKTNNNVAFFQLDNGGYIQLPILAKAIKTVTVNMYETNFSGQIYLAIGNEECSNVENYGSSRYVLTNTTADADSRISLKTTKMFKIKSIEVETREPLKWPEPANLTVTGKKLSWSTVNNAVSYDVTVGSVTANVQTNSYEFKGVDEWYDVSVVAKADEHSDSYIDSESKTAHLKFGVPALQKPVLTVEGMTATTLKIKWLPVDKASGYAYTINNSQPVVFDSNNRDYYNEEGYYVVPFSGLEGGKSYTVEVTAKHADNDVYSSSSESITVTLPNVQLTGDGSVGGPYNINDIYNLRDNGLLNLAGKYVTGTVASTPAPVLNANKTMSYTIEGTDKNGQTVTWEVIGKDLGNAGFSSADELPAGSEVVIYYTDDTNNYLYSIGDKTSILTGIKVVSGQTTFDFGAKFVEPEVNGTYRGKTDEKITGCTFTIGESTITADTELTDVGKQTVTVAKEGFTDTYVITVKAKEKKTYTHRFNTGEVDKSLKSNTDGGITTTLTNFVYKKDPTSGFVKSNGKIGTITTSPIEQKINKIKFYSNGYDKNDNKGIVVTVLVNGVEKGSTTISAKGDYEINLQNNNEANAVYELSFAESVNRAYVRYIIYTNE